MISFADKLHNSIEKRNSFLVAGFDPVLENFPQFVLDLAAFEATTDAAIFKILTSFYAAALSALSPRVAAIKPNIAFFEQYGISGLRAFYYICAEARERGIPVVVDGKRADIGHSAQAYSRAFLGKTTVFGREEAVFYADALTVNPYLGFDTIEPFIKDCATFGKGIFVLVKTSNPGSKALQNLKGTDGRTTYEVVADFLAEHAETLKGSCGYSGLGAVVGATYPEEARMIRTRMPTNLFLIPGMGAQGGSASEAVAGFGAINGRPGGAIINSSRALMGTFKTQPQNFEELGTALAQNADAANQEIAKALRGSPCSLSPV